MGRFFSSLLATNENKKHTKTKLYLETEMKQIKMPSCNRNQSSKQCVQEQSPTSENNIQINVWFMSTKKTKATLSAIFSYWYIAFLCFVWEENKMFPKTLTYQDSIRNKNHTRLVDPSLNHPLCKHCFKSIIQLYTCLYLCIN